MLREWERFMQSPERPTSRDGDPRSDTPGPGGRLLLVEPDELTRWSITTYLRRWFEVEVVRPGGAAVRLAAEGPFAAVVLSEELPDREAAAIQEHASRRNATVTMVRMVTGAAEPDTVAPHAMLIEKPFDLARLAHLLGISEQDISSA